MASKEKKRAPPMCTHLPRSFPRAFLIFPTRYPRVSFFFRPFHTTFLPVSLSNVTQGSRCVPHTILRLLVPIGRCLRAIHTTMITFRQLTLNLRAEENSHSENLSRNSDQSPHGTGTTYMMGRILEHSIRSVGPARYPLAPPDRSNPTPPNTAKLVRFVKVQISL